MIIALGLQLKDLQDDKQLAFAKQIGAEGIVAHLVDYKGINLSFGTLKDTSYQLKSEANLEIWSTDSLKRLVQRVESFGLRLVGIENFDPGLWYDVLLGGPKREEQIENVKTCIRNAASVGIRTIHYNFSLAGIWGWHKGPYARGGASSIAFKSGSMNHDQPIPKGMVWNMYYEEPTDEIAFQEDTDHEELWERVNYFLQEVLPTAEECQVKLAAHPDDPPVDYLRGSARLINKTSKFGKLINLKESPSNGINFCLGTVQEMEGDNVCQTLEELLTEDKVHIIHFRNVKGKVPDYYEVFPDEGDLNMKRIVEILERHNYHGIIMPDHTPEVTCDAPWHAGMAYTMGYLKGLLAK